MTLSQKVTTDIGAAMKAREAGRLTALRMLKTALTNKSIEKGRELDATEDVQVVSSLVKQRREAIEQFRAGGRADLVAKEEAEIAVLETYLPPAASPEAIDAVIARAIADTGAAGPKDIGKVMKTVMAALAGQTVDGKQVNDLVRRKLGA
jgi:uncharacterized protein YqeY